MRSFSLWTGMVLVVGGLAIVGYFGWQYWGSNLVAQAEQRNVVADLNLRWENDGKVQITEEQLRRDGDPGANEAQRSQAYGIMRVPRFGSAYQVPIVRGLNSDSLASGIGWDTGSARPGQNGNSVYAAHRVTHGEPFRNFPSLEAGDVVEIETGLATYTYRLDDGGTDRIVDVEDSWVTNPVPREIEDQVQAQAKPDQALLTLITCTDLFHSDRRSVVTGTLVSTELKRN